MAITRIGNIASTIPDDSIQNAKFSNIVQSKNIIINGDMSIAQRGTSESGVNATGYYTVDRFKLTNASSGTWTQSQSTDVPTGQGFATSLKMDCTTADASPSAGDILILQQLIEGQMLQYLKKGTSNAQQLTLSFWVKSNKTGTYICELRDVDNDRTISKSYTIDTANTWEKKTLTFAGDTTGALDNDNAESLRCNFFLNAGSTYTSGTLATDWESRTNANRAVGQVNLADSTANDWYITGIQLEAGTTASDFEFLPVDVNLQRCQRYCYSESSSRSTYHAALNGFFASATIYKGVLNLPTTIRSSPTLTISGSWFASGTADFTASSFILPDSTGNNINTVQVRANVSGATAGASALLRNNNDASATFLLTSEL
jgi:hypothetical protein